MAVSFNELNDKEIYELDGVYFMKGSNSLGERFAVNLEDGNVERVEENILVNPTNLDTSSIWE